MEQQDTCGPKAQKDAGSLRKVLAYCMVASLAGLIVTLEFKRQDTSKQLAAISAHIEQNEENADVGGDLEEADAVIANVRKLIQLPDNIDPTVATIVDVDTLRERNAFYNSAKNGDYLVVTTERAIIYDPVDNIIKDVVPVQIQPVSAADSAGEGVEG